MMSADLMIVIFGAFCLVYGSVVAIIVNHSWKALFDAQTADWYETVCQINDDWQTEMNDILEDYERSIKKSIDSIKIPTYDPIDISNIALDDGLDTVEGTVYSDGPLTYNVFETVEVPV